MESEERRVKIRVEMTLNGHSLNDLADLLGIHYYSLLNKLKGATAWKVVELKRLAEIYEKEDAYFF